MAIPKFYELFPLILQILHNGKVVKLMDISTMIAEKIDLTEDERLELLPSGNQTVIRNRSDWAAYYLRRAGLLKVEKRGYYQISDVGLNYIDENGYKISLADLEKFESFQNFMEISKSKGDNASGKVPIRPADDPIEIKTPEEQIENAMRILNQQLADELISEIMLMPPEFFEKLVIDLLLSMGYGGKDKRNSKLTQLSNDEGIDGLIKEDELGLDHIYIQAKRWKDTVNRTEIQRFVGALSGFGARKGVFITTSKFSSGAEEYASRQLLNKVILISGDRLARLMMTYGVGLNIENTYVIRKIDRDYFSIDD